MATKRITELDAAISVAETDLLPVDVDPGGTPATKRATVAQIVSAADPREHTHAGYVPASAVTAVGDLLVGSGVGTVARLPADGNGKMLVADAMMPLGLRYATPLMSPLGAQGDLMVGAASGLVNHALASSGASATALQSNVGAGPEYVLDNNDGSMWETSQPVNNWLRIDLGQARVINTIRVHCTTFMNNWIRRAAWACSTDGANWTPIGTHTLAGNDDTWYLREDYNARYWRMTILETGGGAWASCCTVALSGGTAPGTPVQLPAGSNGQILMADSAQANGLHYVGAQQAHIAGLKATYAAGDLDTEAEVIAALNATNAALNAIVATLEAYRLAAAS